MQEPYNLRIRLAVCDDDLLDLEKIVPLAKEILQKETISAGISAFASGAALLRAIQAGAKFEILLLDVMMEGLDGMSLAAALRAQNDSAAIIFISANREMAMKGYEVAAVRYLAKPVDPEKLREALVFCWQSRLQSKDILLPASRGRIRIDPATIVYAETWERGVRLTLLSDKIVASVKISELSAMLPKEQFARCHRTVLVNLAFVSHIRYCELELKSGERLPISKYRLPEVKAQLLRYLNI